VSTPVLRAIGGWLSEVKEFLVKWLADDEVRAEVLRDLGFPNPEATVPAGIDTPALDEYVRSANGDDPSEFLAFQSALADLAVMVDVIRQVVIASSVDSTEDAIDEGVYLLAAYLSTSFVRVRSPETHSLGRLLGLLQQQGADAQGTWVGLKNALRFLGDAGHRREVVDEYFSLEDEADARRLSEDLLLGPAAALATLSLETTDALFLPEIAALYGWDPPATSTTPVADVVLDRVFSTHFSFARLPAEPAPTVSLALVPEVHGGPGLLFALGLEAGVDLPVGNWGVLELKSTPAKVQFTVFWSWDSSKASSEVDGALDPKVSFELREATGDGDPNGRRERLFVVGPKSGTRVELERPRIRATLAAAGPQVAIGAEQARLFVDPAGTDGFLADVLRPLGDGFTAETPLGVGWDPDRGLHLEAGDSLELLIPIGRSLGPLDVSYVRLGLERAGEGDETGITLGFTTSLSAQLGPATAIIDDIGLRLTITFPDDGGNTGLGDVRLGFAPPKGVGISLDTPAVSGGGYLYFDPDNERYAGVLQIDLGVVSVSAIGLITTRLPGGASGFSFLLLLTGEFPPIQLGFGFTLDGLGGLVGIHRTALEAPIRDGVRDRTLDSILFPEDPLANAPRIVRDLRRVFPPTRNQYVFGPMAMLGWGGGPTKISLEVALILTLPSPLVLIIVGQLRARMPSEKTALVSINLDAAGAINFTERRAWIEAAFFDSRITLYVLTGESAMRASWGSRPGFALAAGGFHPAFAPPQGFPTLERLQISLTSGNNPRLSLSVYMALTSNSVQFGALAEVYASALGFTVQGHLGFDALFYFSPFRFVIFVSAGVSVSRNSSTLFEIGLDLRLEGPSPWYVRGEAVFRVLFEISVSFEKTFGKPSPGELPSSDAWIELRQALASESSWSAQLPSEGAMLVTVRKVESDRVLAHPAAVLTVRQRVIPLGIEIDLLNQLEVRGHRLFEITDVVFGEGATATSGEARGVEDHFAPGQFLRMTDQEKLSAPSFEEFESGVEVAADVSTRDDAPVTASFGYETVVVDRREEERQQGLHSLSAERLAAAARSSRAAGSRLAKAGGGRYAGDDKMRVAVADRRFTIASTDDLAAADGAGGPEPMRASSHAAARAALRRHERSRAGEKGRWQVLGDHEVEAA